MEQKQNWLERPIHPSLPFITNEIVIFAAIILLAIVTRFYNLGTRVMSHDESLHTFYSWNLYRGQGYQHSPMMHGPLQFHMVALTYFLFGANDFTSRIPAVLFNIAMIWMVWYWRRYLGKWGALIAGFLLLISPYLLFYARYVRNESFTGLSGIIMLYAILRHLEVGGKKYLYMLAAALVLHFLTKETAFIYAAQALLFLAIYFIAQVTRRPWESREKDYRTFIIALAIAILLVGATVGYGLYARDKSTISGAETVVPANPSDVPSPLAAPETGSFSPIIILAFGGILALAAAGYLLIRGYTWERIRAERSFDLLMVTGTLVLPMLSPFAVKLTEGWFHVAIPAEVADVRAMLADPKSIAVIGGFLAALFILSAVIGLIWNKGLWWKIALVFWVPFTVFYTTIFTNSDGFFTGTVGSLGYWLVQQGVSRGSQPWYYYTLIQIPMYEFLPALGLILALIIGLRRRLTQRPITISENNAVLENNVGSGNIEGSGNDEVIELITKTTETSEETNFPNMFSLLVWWSVTSIVAFSYAGEKMPWLTFHMAWPMILITGWALGRVVETTDWEGLRERRALLTLATMAIFVASLVGVLLSVTGSTPPFQGKDLAQLQATSAFLLPAIVALVSAFAVTYLLRDWNRNHMSRVFILMVFGLLAVLTGRAAFRASYITYDQATEFLIYAHGATGIKDVIAQAKDISERTTGGMGIALAYDASAPDTGVSWPFVWYLRDFTNQRSFDQPTRSLRDSVVVIVDQKNFDKIEPALGPGFYREDYIRMWWPMQDYFTIVTDRDASQPFPEDYACKGLLGFFKLFKARDYSRFCSAFTNPGVRAGIIQIWLNRDYTAYAQATGRSDLTLTTWNPADQMRFYIRKDVASQIWNYGVGPTQVQEIVDPTEGKVIVLPADLILDAGSQNALTLNAPRALAFAPDGTFYVADSRNNRILHLNAEGRTLNEWGTSSGNDLSNPNPAAPPSTFNEPWGVAVGPDGSVYVTDTWNFRIQKFTASGKFIKMWSTYPSDGVDTSFYGPRGLAVDSRGQVYVTDTGNKRVVVFDSNGTYITQFGSAGMDPGLFDEPVGITVDKDGKVYVADTWNQRVQTFVPSPDGLDFVPDKQWNVYGWFGQSLDNKPFIAVNNTGHVFITDPEGCRVMEFDPNGVLIRVWGDLNNGPTGFGLASGIAIDAEGHVWVTDGLYNRVLRFTLP